MQNQLRGRVAASLFALLAASAYLINGALAAPQTDIYVTETVLVSSKRYSRDLTDFTYRIKVTNQGGALVGARALVRSSSANTVILDNEVVLGDVPRGTTLTSDDTFSLRQNRLVAFNPANLIWVIDAQPANTRPVANAGPDQTVRTGVTVTLDGTASSDADGNSLNYRWALTSRPAGSSAALSSATAGRPTFVVDRGGTYVFSLVVNDGMVDSLADEVRVSTTNSTPIANAGLDRTVPRGSVVILDGSASSDPDFNSLTFSWTVVGAPNGSTATLDNPGSISPRITLDRPGTYSFRLTVNDGQLTSAPDTVVISTENSAPVANAGDDQTGTVGIRVTLDAWRSSDADNDPVSASWTWVSRPAGSAVPLETSDSFRPFFVPDRPGLYVLQLIVNDGFVDSAPDTTTITIQVPANRPPNAVVDTASTPENTAVTIDVLANDTDPDQGTTLTLLSFTQPATGGAVVQVSGGLRFTPTVGFSGIASFQYTISDGALQASGAVNVTVVANANQPPAVNAGSDAAITLPGSGAALASLLGTVTDDGRPLPVNLTVSWSTVSGPGSVVFSAPDSASTNASFTVAGTYVLRLSASDGALSTSDTVQVIVSPPANSPPTLNAISDRTLNVGTPLRLQLLANDNDPLDTLTFAMNSAPNGASFSAPVVSWTPTNAQIGTSTFTVSVRDAIGASDSKSFRVTVVSSNRKPVFGPLADDSTVTFARYAKNVTATDPDGDAVTLSLLEGPAGLTLNGNLLAWQPGATQIGSFTVKLRATDTQGAFSAALFRITVSAAQRPVARDDSYKVKVGETLTVAAPGVLTNDSSPSGGPLSANKISDPALGSLTAFNANGSLTYLAPAADPKPPFAIVASKVGNATLYRQPSGLAPALADLNQDGRPDLVYFGYAGPTQVATAISGANNQPLWSDIGSLDANFCENNLGNYPGYALGDLDDDGQIELVTITGCRSGESSFNRLAAFRSDGSRKWVSGLLTKEFFDVRCLLTGCVPGTLPTRSDYSVLFETSLSVARLAANEAPVIMARAEIPANAGQVYTELTPGVLGYKDYGCRIVTGNVADMGQGCDVTLLMSGTDGSVLQVLRSPLRPQFNRGIPISPFTQSPPIAADLDGDGIVEIVSGSDVWKRVGNSWTLAWAGTAEPEQVAVADLDGDGRQEVIWALDRNQNLAANTPYLGFVGILIFDANGQELRRIPLPNRFPGLMTIADVDGDRVPEILMTEGGRLHAIGADGAFKWTYLVPDNPGFPQPTAFRTSYRQNIVVYDLDGDGNNEVIFSSSSGLHILEGRAGTQKAYLNTGPRYAGIQASNTTFVTDWDNDGRADIVSFGEVGGSATEAFAYVIKSANNDWLPAAKIHNQVAFQPASVNEAGRILFDPSMSRSYRNPQQLGVVRDPRETAGTVFDYVASDGMTDSQNARVFVAIAPPNSPPVFTSRPPTVIQAEGATSTVTYQAIAVDPDVGDTITYALEATSTSGNVGPSIYMDINPGTGVVSIVQSTSFGGFTWRVTLTATDSQGASATQTFVVRHETRPRITVPDVVGAALLTAAQTLTAADFQSTVLQEQFNALPAGQVIAQNPVANSPQPRGTTVLLTVSKGPAPTLVPNVVGRFEPSAVTSLTAAGFTAAITREFSNTVDAGVVISQAIPAGTEQAGGAVSIAISAGSGLDLRLSRSVTPANEPIPFTLVSTDVNGVIIGAPSVVMSITALSAASGPLPTVAGAVITAAANTRGRYRLTVTEGSKVSGVEFVVAQPNTVAKRTQLAYFARFETALVTMDSLLAEANAARLANDTATMNARMIAWVNTWRSIDLGQLSLSVPVVPEGGFPLSIEETSALGVVQTPDDAMNKIVLKDASDDLLAIEEALRDPITPYVQIRNLFATFKSRAERLRSLAPGEYGVIDAKSLYADLLAHRIPQVMDALVEDVARSFGLPARKPYFSGLVRNEVGESGGEVLGARGARPWVASLAAPGNAMAVDDSAKQVFVNSTLAEQLTTLVVTEVTNAVGGGYTVRKFYQAAFVSAVGGAVIVAAVQHIKALTNANDLTVTTGASLSFNVFEADYSTIEGLGLNGDAPAQNTVMIVGPELFLAFRDSIEKLKGLGGLASQAAGVNRAKDLDEIQNGLEDFYDKAKEQETELTNAADRIRKELAAVYQTPSPRAAVSDCLIEGSGPLCRSIQYRNGFRSVYASLGLNLPTPVAFVVVNNLTGAMAVGSPIFLPHPVSDN